MVLQLGYAVLNLPVAVNGAFVVLHLSTAVQVANPRMAPVRRAMLRMMVFPDLKCRLLRMGGVGQMRGIDALKVSAAANMDDVA